YQQGRAERLGVRVAYDWRSSASLALERAATRDEPLCGAIGIGGGWIALLAGVGALAALAFGRLRSADPARRDAALLALLYVAVVCATTALWIPIDWDRYFLPFVPCFALVEACAVGIVLREWRSRATRDADTRNAKTR